MSERHRYEETLTIISAIEWTPDGKSLAIASCDQYSEDEIGNATLRLFDPNANQTTRVLYEEPQDDRIIESLAWGGTDGTLLAGFGASDEIRGFSITTGKLVTTYHRSYADIRSISTNSTGTRLASVGWNRLLDIHDTETGRLITSIDVGAASEWIGWSPEGRRIAAACWDGVARIWDANTLTLEHELTVSPSNRLWSGTWCPDGTKIAVGTTDGYIQVWNVNTGLQERIFDRRSNEVYDLDWNPTKNRLASVNASIFRVWDTRTGQQLFERLGALRIKWSPDGTQLAYGGFGGAVEIVTVSNEQMREG